MSIGYDPTRFGKITSLNQLLSRKFAHSIALDGNPAQAPSALYGVMMINLALGGTPGNLSARRSASSTSSPPPAISSRCRPPPR